MCAHPASASFFPERVGRYELLLPLGSGGAATVYLARLVGPGGFVKEVALKLLHQHLREESNQDALLLEEARIAAKIRHPNVVPVLDAGEDAFGTYLCLEYIEGDTVSALLRAASASDERVVPLDVGLRILDDALSGLEAAHALTDANGAPLNLVHRDFSPQNILVGLDGVARLTDFGIAKASDGLFHTKHGYIKGKVCYFSPEQARGEPLDRKSDVWAAGVVAWEIFAGRRLYPKADDLSVMFKIIGEPAPLLGSVRPDVPRHIEAAVASALTQDLARRCPSAAELRRRLVADERLASAERVGAYVGEIAGEKLRERRGRVEEVARLRVQMGTLVRAAVSPPEISSPAAVPARIQTEVTLEPIGPMPPPTEVTLAPGPLEPTQVAFAPGGAKEERALEPTQVAPAPGGPNAERALEPTLVAPAPRTAVAPKDSTVAAKDGTVAARDGTVAARDGTVAARDGTVAARDGKLAPKVGTLAPKVGTLAQNEDTLSAKIEPEVTDLARRAALLGAARRPPGGARRALIGSAAALAVAVLAVWLVSRGSDGDEKAASERERARAATEAVEAPPGAPSRTGVAASGLPPAEPSGSPARAAGTGDGDPEDVEPSAPPPARAAGAGGGAPEEVEPSAPPPARAAGVRDGPPATARAKDAAPVRPRRTTRRASAAPKTEPVPPPLAPTPYGSPR